LSKWQAHVEAIKAGIPLHAISGNNISKEITVNGFQIAKRPRKVNQQAIDKFRDVPVANISDCMSRMTAGGPTLRPMHNGAYLCGPAFTVKTRPGDNLMIHKALDLAEPGDIIVVDAGGDLTNSLVGELMVGYATKRGLGGMVINGAIRDSAILREGGFPVYAAGVTHRGPYKDGPGEINFAVAFDGMVVQPGDLIVGDADGVLCIPFDQVETVFAAVREKMQLEAQTIANIEKGTHDTAWIDAKLRSLGCVITD
jgi:regulator of RNase E activity RraA